MRAKILLEQCPFSKRSDRDGKRNVIICEGITEHSNTHHWFFNQKARDEYAKDYCCNLYGFKECVHYKAVMTKYEEA